MGSRPKIQFSTILTILLLGVLMSQISGAEKVLLVPPPYGDSHWFALAKIGQVLVNRGHVVTAVLAEDIVDERRAQFPDLRYETFQDQGTRARLTEVADHQLGNAGQVSAYQFLQVMITTSEETSKHCDLLLGDSNLVGRLTTAQFSVIIVDPFFSCGAMLADHIDARVPVIAVGRADAFSLDVEATGAPIPLSYVPYLIVEHTDQMNFVQRVENVAGFFSQTTAGRLYASYVFDGLVRKHLGEGETIQTVTLRTDLWLYQQDLLLDFIRPMMPNMVLVGGLNVREVVTLGEELEAFVQSSGEDGVVVVSLGTVVKTMSPEKKEAFATAFARLRQKVVWRYEEEKKPAGLGSNTKLLAWLPQNDLLGHPKTRVFVTHVGSNSMYEALHHGVPMVCLPLFADQPINAVRVVARGLGVKLDFDTVTTDQLYEAIHHVLTNNSYQETAARLSRLHRDQPQSPMERAVWWIEHVIRHSGLPHLRARAVELPFYQYYLLDVAAFLLAICSAVLGAVWCSCSLMCRKCCAKRSGKSKFE